MTWTGKAIGGVLGLLTRRWQFVLLGIALGHLFDMGLFRRAPVEPPAPPTPDDDPFRVLEVSPTATDAEIEAAYRRLITQYHPDRMSGAAPEILALAQRRSQAINAAYERIRKSRKGR